VWEALTGEGATPVPYDVWEFHRIANGFPVYGAEFGVQTNPLESRLQGSISYNKGCYIGQEVIARLTTYKKVQRRLMSARLDGSVQAGARLIFEGTPVGYITSSATSPLGQYTAISMVNSLHAIVGKEMSVADTEIAVELIEPAYALSTEPALVID
jgi:folate-binding protein YgfZ